MEEKNKIDKIYENTKKAIEIFGKEEDKKKLKETEEEER